MSVHNDQTESSTESNQSNTYFIAQYKPDFSLMENVRMEPESLVGNDQHWIDDSSSVGVNVAVKFAVNVILTAGINDQRVQTATEPFFNFILPILIQIFEIHT